MAGNFDLDQVTDYETNEFPHLNRRGRSGGGRIH
jgi:hypothetical protein